jgi:pimeloyl-ACP methyl ester carboxylesterase
MKALVLHGAGSSPEAVSWLYEPIKEFGYEVYVPKYESLEEIIERYSREKYDLYAGFSLGGAASLILSSFHEAPVIAVGAPADRLLQARWLSIHEERSPQREIYMSLVKSLGGEPYQNPMAYIKTSVLYYIEKIRGPVLLIQGSEDPIVRPFHSIILEDFLRKLGVRVERVVIEGMRHAPAGHHRGVIREVIFRFLGSLGRTK